MNHASRGLRLAFAGTPPFAVPALDALHAAGHEIAAVFTQADRPAGRGRTVQPGAVKARALELKLAVHQPTSFKCAAVVDLLRNIDADALIVVAYGLILPPAALTAPRLGCFNLHASLLPRWRGAAPIQRTLQAGDPVTGVSIMRMEPGLDTGPVLAVRRVKIDPRDNAATLQERLAAVGAGLLCETLDALARGTAVETPQPAQGVCYAAKIEKSEAPIDWRMDADSIVRQVRAFNPWPVAETRLRGRQLRIWGAELGPPSTRAALTAPGTVIAVSKQGIDVACARGVVRITLLQLSGRKAVSAQAFAHAEPLGDAVFSNP